MPDLDGFAATEKIRDIEASNKATRTPIIALTAHAMKEHQERCQAVGMDDYLAKPLDMADLYTVLQRWAAK